MAHSKTTSKPVASKASKALRTSKNRTVRSIAGSALSQKHGKVVRKGPTVSPRPPRRKK